MNYIEGIPVLPIIGFIAIAGVCMWHGRRVRKVDWKDDEDNPANWYLRDPNKFRRG